MHKTQPATIIATARKDARISVTLKGGHLPTPVTRSVPSNDRTAWRELAQRLFERYGIPKGDTLNTLQEAIIEAKARNGDGHPAEASVEARPGAELESDFQPIIVKLEEVAATPVEWLWPKRIPLGRLTLLVGKPGQGKSFLTCDLAARVTTGTPWPDGSPCQKGSVLILTMEDDPADTIRPRLDAMHADVARVRVLKGMVRRDADGSRRERGLTLADLAVIEKALDDVPDCRLLIIDPVGDFLGLRVDSHRDNEVRSVLAPLGEMARRRKVAVLVVVHRRKSTGDGGADEAVMGSRGFTGIARSVWHVSRDADDKQRRLFLAGKQNLSEESPGLAFRIVGEPPRVEWDREPVNMTADEALERERQASRPGPEADAQEDAKAFLLAALSGGPRLAKDVTREWTEAHCGSDKTLQRAKNAVGIVSYRPENPGPWWWRLPDRADGQARSQGALTQITWPSGPSALNNGVSEHSRGAHGQDGHVIGEPGHVPNDPEPAATKNHAPALPGIDPEEVNRRLVEAAEADGEVWVEF
ncbi:AAA family ATPase [Thermopirellula anaerolimosa]